MTTATPPAPTSAAPSPGMTMLARDREREEVTLALQNRPGFDLAAVSEDEFEQGLDRIRTRQHRMQRILDTVLREDVHYGNPKTAEGKPVFQKPMLYKAGVEELIGLFRLRPVHMEAPQETMTEDYVAVRVRMGIVDSRGNLVLERSGSCNTRERRFERRDHKGYTYQDAREKVHDCLMMAEIRAMRQLVCGATGATAFFAAEEDMEKALAEDLEASAPPPEPCSEADRQRIMSLAAAAGIRTKQQFETFLHETIGRSLILVPDVQPVVDALGRRKAGVQAATPSGDAFEG